MIAGRINTLAAAPRTFLNRGRPRAIVILDLDDVTAAVQRACDPPHDQLRLDLDALRDFIFNRAGQASFVCLAPGEEAALDLLDEQAVTQAGWRWSVPGPRLWDADVRPAVGYTCALLECLRFEHGLLVPPVVLISHDAAWVGPVERYLEAGGRVIGIGLVEMFHNHQIELTDHHGLHLLDLEFDAGAATLPSRRMFQAREGMNSAPGRTFVAKAELERSA